MQHIQIPLKTKSKSLDLSMSIAVDGTEVYVGRADSLVGGYARILYALMSAKPVTAVQHVGYRNVIAVTRQDADTVRVQTNSNSGNTGPGDLISIEGVLGIPGFPNEVTFEAGFNDNDDFIYFNDGGALDVSGYVAGSGEVRQMLQADISRGPGTAAQAFTSPTIELGTGTKAVEVSDYRLDRRITSGTLDGELLYGSQTTSLPAVAGQQSEITVSRQFTNNSPATINVEEIGLMADSVHANPTLIARDLRAFSIPAGSTATVSYKMFTTADASGGTTIQFNELMTRRLKSTTREVKDIDNQNRVEENAHWDFITVSGIGGVGAFQGHRPNGVDGADVGPVVGTGTTAVTQTDYQLAARVPHADTGQPGGLVHLGAFAEGFEEDAVAGTAGFDVKRMFVNASGADVTVTEAGLNVGGGFDDNTYDDVRYAYMIARDVLDQPVTIPDGEALMLTYRVEVSL